jgi:membrane-associated phospholipid phosphatase
VTPTKSINMRPQLLPLILLLPLTAIADDSAIEQAGNNLRIALPAIAAGVSLLKGDLEGTFQFAQSIVATSATTLALKSAVDKRRPNGESKSFPSGHTAVAFSGAAFLQRRYGLRYGVPAYIAASYVGWGRIKTDNHWSEDVVAAALLATSINHYLVDPLPAQKLQISFSIQDKGLGAQFHYQW